MHAKGKPTSGIIIERERTHYTISNKRGEYILEGLLPAKRKLSFLKKQQLLLSKEIYLTSDAKALDLKIYE